MVCPLCTTEYVEVSLSEYCPKCNGCVNPWHPQVAIAAIDGHLRNSQKFVVLLSVLDWQAIIEATVTITPHVAVLTESYTRRLLNWIYNNPPTPVQIMTITPGSNDMWRGDLDIQAFLAGLSRA